MKSNFWKKIIAYFLVLVFVFSGFSGVFAEDEVPYAEAARGTPIIDGIVDDIWNETEVITTTRWAQGSGGATGTARVLWDDKYLYVLAFVYDTTLDDTSIHPWERDCIEVYIDENNGKTDSYQEDDAYYRVGFTNELSGMDNVNLEGVRSAAGFIEGGYMIELQIPFRYKSASTDMIGFDFHVNDAIDGERRSIAAWSDQNNVAYLMPSAMGNLKLCETTDRKSKEKITIQSGSTQRPESSGTGTNVQNDDIDGTSVVVDFKTKRQVMEGIGGNFAKNRMRGTAITTEYGKNDPIGEYCLEHLNPHYVRVGIPIVDFEPENDNSDANSINFAAFYDDGYVHQNFLLLQDFSKDGRIIIGSVWDVPNWMVENPENTENRIIKENMYEELAESIAAFVKYAKDKYGINISYLSFNESEIGVNIKFTGEQYARIIKLTGKKLESLGFSNIKWLAGDTGNSKGLVAFAKAQLEDPECLPYIGAISYHSWDVNEVNESWLEKIYELAQQYNLPVWVGEVGYDALLFRKPNFNEMLESWEGASRLGINYYKAITYTGASNLLYWQYQWDFNLLDIYGNIFPSFYFVKQLNETLLPGMTVVSAKSDNGNILPVVSYSKDQVTVNIWSNSTKEGQITVNNLPNGAYTMISSSEKGEYVQTAGIQVADNKVSIVMPPKSMVTIYLKVNDNTILDYVHNPVMAVDVPQSGAQNRIGVKLNGSFVSLSDAPFLQNDRIMVPVRDVFTKMGAQVEWNEENQQVLITKGKTHIVLKVGEAAVVNGQIVTLEVPPVIFNSRIFVPVRFISEMLNAEVEWDDESSTVFITYEPSIDDNNLLQNGGFEEGMEHWTVDEGNGVVSISQEVSYAGSHSLKITATGNTVYNGVCQSIAVDKNTEYEITFWTKGDDISSAFDVTGVDGTSLIPDGFLYNRKSSEWIQNTVKIFTGENHFITIKIFDEGVPGMVYYDNILVRKYVK